MGLLGKREALTHPVCAAELLEGARDRADFRDLQRFLIAFRRVAVKAGDFQRCLELMDQHRLSHGIGWADCLIAATCIRLRLPLATLNDRHFSPVGGLRVLRPY